MLTLWKFPGHVVTVLRKLWQLQIKSWHHKWRANISSLLFNQ